MATPRVRGHEFRFTRYLWYERPAFIIGLSIRCPPATMPMVARHLLSTVFREPDGSLDEVDVSNQQRK